MDFATLSPAWRTRLAKFVLVVTAGTTLATSDSDWHVQDQQELELPPAAAGELTVHAEVRYQAPQGAWPLRLSAYVSEPSPRRSVEQDVVFDPAEVSASSEDPDLFEVRCASKLCEGIMTADFRIAGQQTNEDTSADAGLYPPVLRVSAGVQGGPVGGNFFVDCSGQDSSTDLESPPSTLRVDLTIDPLDDALFGDAGVSDAGGSVGSSVLSPVRGLDAGRE